MTNKSATTHTETYGGKNTRGIMVQVVAFFCFFFAVSGLYFLIEYLRIDIRSNFPDKSRIVTNFLEQLPTEPLLYFTFATLIVSLLYRAWYLSKKLSSEITNQREYARGKYLSDGDWWVIKDLRQRSLNLRMRANFILFGIFMLLFGGIYLVLFVLADLQQNEQVLEARLKDEIFKDAFGETLQSLANGLYWIKVNSEEISSRFNPELQVKVDSQNQYEIIWRNIADGKILNALSFPESGTRPTSLALSADGRIGLISNDRGEVLLQTMDNGNIRNASNLGVDLGQDVTTLALSADGTAGVIADRNRSVFVTWDSGERWSSPDIEMRPEEWVVSAAFSADGKTVLLAGDEGSVFVTKDRGQSWSAPAIESQPGTPTTTLALSADGTAGVIADRNRSVFVTWDSGERWSSPDIEMRPEEWVVSAAFSADGKTVLLAGDEGSVFVTKDRGQSWSAPAIESQPRSPITALALSADGTTGVIAYRNRSVFVTWDGGKNWSSPNIEMRPEEWVDSTAFSVDKKTVFLEGDEGSAFVTEDSGQSWKPLVWELRPGAVSTMSEISASGNVMVSVIGETHLLVSEDDGNTWKHSKSLWQFDEQPVRRVSSNDGRTTLVAGDQGSVILTRDSGATWSAPQLKPPVRPGVTVTVLGLAPDGSAGVIGYQNRSDFVTWDGGESWISLEVDMRSEERLAFAAFDTERMVALLGGDDGSVFMTRDGGQHWSSPDLESQTNTTLTSLALSANGMTGVIANKDPSVFLTWDGGLNWELPELELRPEEWIVSASFSEDGGTVLLVGDEGSIVVSRSGGRSWAATVGLGSDDLFNSASVVFPNGDVVTQTRNGHYYVLRSYSELVDWRGQTSANIVTLMKKNEMLMDSNILEQIREFDADYRVKEFNRLGQDNVDTPAPSTTPEAPQKPLGGSMENIFDDLRIMQVATLAVLFFLVHILVRLHQYSLRLAAFWDSRCDAVLLAENFAGSPAVNFDNLVHSFAPDAYDFKPHPGIALNWLWRERKS